MVNAAAVLEKGFLACLWSLDGLNGTFHVQERSERSPGASSVQASHMLVGHLHHKDPLLPCAWMDPLREEMGWPLER